MNQTRKIELIKQHLELSISNDVSESWSNVDCRIYSEQTADGYDLHVVTNQPDHPIICEDCYQYEHDLADAFEDQVRWGDKTFYICEYLHEDAYIDDKLEQMFDEAVEDIIENDDLNITLQEINLLKEEYGITEEVED